MVPKLIHHLWIDPSKPFSTHLTIPSDVQENLASWRDKEVAYYQKIWLLNEIHGLCEAHRLHEVSRAIAACRFPSMQADIARLLLMKVIGGFWVDLKLYLNLRFLDRLVQNDLIFTEHFPKADLPNPNGRLSNSFMGAVPAHPVITAALARVVKNVHSRMKGSIYHVTGATNLELAVEEINQKGSYFIMAHQTAWDYLFSIRSGSYNGSNLHWSLREQRECPYID
jgi:mannosyltransferase OCH1-like enzyme